MSARRSASIDRLGQRVQRFMAKMVTLGHSDGATLHSRSLRIADTRHFRRLRPAPLDHNQRKVGRQQSEGLSRRIQ